MTKESKGRGLTFNFVDPIVKAMKKRKYSAPEEVVLEWNSYPKAAEYSVQVYEKKEPYTWSNNTLFEWSNRPKVSGSQMRLKEYDVQLKPGYFYTFEVKARDKQGGILTETSRKHSGYDFEFSE